MTGRGPLRKRRSALDCRAIEEDERDDNFRILKTCKRSDDRTEICTITGVPKYFQ
jgi:hypothetical protein